MHWYRPAGSIFKFFVVDKFDRKNTTAIPQIIPIANAPAGLTAAQPAVTLQDPLQELRLRSVKYLVFFIDHQVTNIAAITWSRR
jgi:hypothetical protein